MADKTKNDDFEMPIIQHPDKGGDIDSAIIPSEHYHDVLLKRFQFPSDVRRLSRCSERSGSSSNSLPSSHAEPPTTSHDHLTTASIAQRRSLATRRSTLCFDKPPLPSPHVYAPIPELGQLRTPDQHLNDPPSTQFIRFQINGGYIESDYASSDGEGCDDGRISRQAEGGSATLRIKVNRLVLPQEFSCTSVMVQGIVEAEGHVLQKWATQPQAGHCLVWGEEEWQVGVPVQCTGNKRICSGQLSLSVFDAEQPLGTAQTSLSNLVQGWPTHLALRLNSGAELSVVLYAAHFGLSMPRDPIFLPYRSAHVLPVVTPQSNNVPPAVAKSLTDKQQSEGRLKVRIIRASHLPQGGDGGSYFCRVTVGGQVQLTTSQPLSQNPIWDEALVFAVKVETAGPGMTLLSIDTVQVQLVQGLPPKGSTTLGILTLSLRDMLRGVKQLHRHPLPGDGELLLEIHPLDFGWPPDTLSCLPSGQIEGDPNAIGALRVKVVRAVPPVYTHEATMPVVRLSLEDFSWQTSPGVINTLWNEQAFLPWGQSASSLKAKPHLDVDVWDSYDPSIYFGAASVDLTQLLQGESSRCLVPLIGSQVLELEVEATNQAPPCHEEKRPLELSPPQSPSNFQVSSAASEWTVDSQDDGDMTTLVHLLREELERKQELLQEKQQRITHLEHLVSELDQRLHSLEERNSCCEDRSARAREEVAGIRRQYEKRLLELEDLLDLAEKRTAAAQHSVPDAQRGAYSAPEAVVQFDSTPINYPQMTAGHFLLENETLKQSGRSSTRTRSDYPEPELPISYRPLGAWGQYHTSEAPPALSVSPNMVQPLVSLDDWALREQDEPPEWPNSYRPALLPTKAVYAKHRSSEPLSSPKPKVVATHDRSNGSGPRSTISTVANLYVPLVQRRASPRLRFASEAPWHTGASTAAPAEGNKKPKSKAKPLDKAEPLQKAKGVAKPVSYRTSSEPNKSTVPQINVIMSKVHTTSPARCGSPPLSNYGSEKAKAQAALRGAYHPLVQQKELHQPDRASSASPSGSKTLTFLEAVSPALSDAGSICSREDMPAASTPQPCSPSSVTSAQPCLDLRQVPSHVLVKQVLAKATALCKVSNVTRGKKVPATQAAARVSEVFDSITASDRVRRLKAVPKSIPKAI